MKEKPEIGALVESLDLETLTFCKDNNIHICLKEAKFVGPNDKSGKYKDDRKVVQAVLNLYLAGDLYPSDFCGVFGFEKSQQLMEVLRREAKKQKIKLPAIKDLYGDRVASATKSTLQDRYGPLGLANPAISAKKKVTNFERYGAASASCTDEVKLKVKETIQNRYGSLGLKNPSITEKKRKTNLQKYGVEWHSQNAEIAERIRKTNLQRFGVEFPFQSKEIRDKAKQTFLQRFGVDNPLKAPHILAKYNATNIERYGAAYPFQSKEIQQKVKDSMLAKYGVVSPMHIPGIAEVHTTSKIVADSRYAGIYALYQESQNYGDELPEEFKERVLAYVSKHYGGKTQKNVHIRRLLGSVNLTSCEIILKLYLDDLGIDYFAHSRTQHGVKNAEGRLYEADFFIPVTDGYGVAIEANGVYWHSTKFKDCWYHLDKRIAFQRAGIKLLGFMDFFILDPQNESFIKNKIIKAIENPWDLGKLNLMSRSKREQYEVRKHSHQNFDYYDYGIFM